MSADPDLRRGVRAETDKSFSDASRAICNLASRIMLEDCAMAAEPLQTLESIRTRLAQCRREMKEYRHRQDNKGKAV